MIFWISVYVAFMSLGYFLFEIAVHLCRSEAEKMIFQPVIGVKWLLIGIGAIIVAVTV